MSLPRRAARTRAASSNASASSGSTSWAPRSMAASASRRVAVGADEDDRDREELGVGLDLAHHRRARLALHRGVEQQHVRAPAARRLEHLGRALGLDHDAAERLEHGTHRAPRPVVRVGHEHARVVQRAEPREASLRCGCPLKHPCFLLLPTWGHGCVPTHRNARAPEIWSLMAPKICESVSAGAGRPRAPPCPRCAGPRRARAARPAIAMPVRSRSACAMRARERRRGRCRRRPARSGRVSSSSGVRALDDELVVRARRPRRASRTCSTSDG